MMKLIKQIKLPKELELQFEENLSYDETIGLLFKRLIKESAKVNLECKNLWRDVEVEIKKIFPEYTNEKYHLSYNWSCHKIDIMERSENE